MFPERRQIVELWKRGDAAALATLVRVEGSSYRRPGARLLITHQGIYAGAISGGCLEAEVLRKAQWLVREGATIQRYSTLFDDTAEIPYGLGCGGTVDVLLEPADTAEFEALMQALDSSLQGEHRRVSTQLPTGVTSIRRCVLNAAGAHVFDSAAGLVGSAERHFDEVLAPPQRLLVFGAGDDAQPLVRLAALLGWTVIVLDGRPQWARPERFPEAAHALVAHDLTSLSIQPADAAVIMTHSYEQDRVWLTALLPHQPRYLGLLGARHRSALLLSEAATALAWTLDRTCEHIFAPIGLDLGGDGAESIALAIVAEIQARIEGRLSGPKRMSATVVAEQLDRGGAARYLQAQCSL